MSAAQRRRPDWGRIAATLFLAGIAAIYLFDARSTSLNVENLILVQPVALLILGLATIVVISALRSRDAPEARSRLTWQLPVLVAAFGLFVLSLERVGIDVATYIFVAVATWLCGERRLLPLAIFTLAFSTFIAWGLASLIPYSIPMTFF